MLTHGRRAAVLGSPISHSLSPVLHRAAYAALGLDWTYAAVEVDEGGLPGFLAGLDGTWAGLSLTMPLKEAVLPLVDRVSELAALTRSANTVLIGEAGTSADNTDVHGMVTAIRGSGGREFGDACILGAGATARSAVAAVAELGARQVHIVARRPEAARDLAALAHRLQVQPQLLPWSEPDKGLRADIVVSTVPGDAAAALRGAVPGEPRVLLDVTYRPWPTSLAAAWRSAGGLAVPGSEMLLWQAVRQVELMTGLPAPAAAMRRALAAAIAAASTG